MKLKVKMLKDEYWYGGDTNIGFFTPLSRKSVYIANNTIVRSYGQSNTLWLSNKGRVIWSDKGFLTKFIFGHITCISNKAEIKLYEAEDKTLKAAYLYAVSNFMQPDGKHPNPICLKFRNTAHGFSLNIIKRRKILCLMQNPF